MISSTRTIPARGGVLSAGWPYRRSRTVTVRVMAGGHEVDRVQSSSPEKLRASLAPVCRHLDEFHAVLVFEGAEERWLAGRIGRRREEIILDGLESALRFLAGTGWQRGDL